MTVEVYKGRAFQYGHERRACGIFLQDLKNRFEGTDDLYIVVIEVDANGAAMDMLIMSSRAIIIAEMKQLTAASEKTPDLIQLRGKENGPWEYILTDEEKTSRVGGQRNTKNPYKQIEQNRHDFAEWLSQNSKYITGSSLTKREAIEKLSGWLVISPGYNGDTSNLNLPWEDIKDHHNWFQIIPIKSLAWQFHCTTVNNLKLTDNEMHLLIDQLGAVKITNLGEVLPEFFPDEVAPLEPAFLFSRLAAAPKIIGREKEMETLRSWLKESETSLISIEGMGGVGKTTLLKHLNASPCLDGWQIKYISCKDKNITIESFLYGVAAEIPDLRKAYLVGNQEPTSKDMDIKDARKKNFELIDRLDTALDFLEAQKTIIIFDDFQRASHARELDTLFLHAPARSKGLKCILCSREHADILDHPELSLNLTRKLVINGFSADEVKAFLISQEKLPNDQELLKLISKKTQGNPYLIGLLIPHILRAGWNDLIPNLPLYKNDFSNWFGSLLDTLKPEPILLAHKLSLLKDDIPPGLIKLICHDKENAYLLTNELVDNYILQRSDLDESYRMHDYLREYLDDHFKDIQARRKILFTAGRYYLRQSELSTGNNARIDLFFSAIQYFNLAGDLTEVFSSPVDNLFETLYYRGDYEKAMNIAEKALIFARQKKDTSGVTNWLLKLAQLEFDQGDDEKAARLIKEADIGISGKGKNFTAIQPEKLIDYKARLSIAQARIAYHRSDFDLAKSILVTAMEGLGGSDNLPLKADILLRIARVERQKGNLSQSKLYFLEVIKISNELKDPQIYIEAISHLGLIARSEKDDRTALKYFTQACHYSKKIQDWRGYEINRSLMADLARRKGDFNGAAKIFKECLAISKQFGNGIAIRVNMGQLTECLIQTGKLKEALPYLNEVQERCEQAGDGIGLAWNLRRRGLFLKRSGDIPGGDALIREGIEKLTQIGSSVYIDDFTKDLGPEQENLPGFQD